MTNIERRSSHNHQTGLTLRRNEESSKNLSLARQATPCYSESRTHQLARWTVAAVKINDSVVGDSDRVYQIKMSDGNLFNDGEWVAQSHHHPRHHGVAHRTDLSLVQSGESYQRDTGQKRDSRVHWHPAWFYTAFLCCSITLHQSPKA